MEIIIIPIFKNDNFIDLQFDRNSKFNKVTVDIQEGICTIINKDNIPVGLMTFIRTIMSHYVHNEII